MTLTRLLLIHAIVTLAAGVVLVLAPGAIPGAVGITVEADAYLVAHLLAAAEFAFAFLSFFARRIDDVAALRVVVGTLIVFHTASAALEIYAFTLGGASAAIWGNVALRIVVIGAFWYWGIRRVEAAPIDAG